MTQRILRGVVAAAALAATLGLAGPAEAAGRRAWRDEGPIFERALQWVARLWADRFEKQGPVNDPDGATATNSRCVPPDACEQGPINDPDG